MHELSIAMSIVEIASEEAQKRRARVDAVHLKLGPLSGVVKDALLFSWELACEESPIAGSRLVIEQTPVVVGCSACRAESTMAEESIDLHCPACGNSAVELKSGRELQVIALEIEEQP